MDRPPNEGWEAETFTYRPASEWEKGHAFIDIPAARKLTNDFLDVFTSSRFVGLLG